jgi:conjugative relaxase-like TrwC/TraI family protein
MLGIGKLAAGAEDYYLRITQGIEDYYVGIEAPGQWIGSSQQLLGLTSEVTPEALRAVFDAHHPTDGTALITTANRRVVAFDLSYKADKTVSLLHAWGGADVAAEVEAAHSRAIDSSLSYLEEHAVFTRRGHNGVEQLAGEGLVAARYRHFRNRNDDPHLHDHVLVPNMVRAADGRWSTIDARHLYTHAKTAGYVYQAVLRHELSTRLGVTYGPVHNGVAPIEGIPRNVVEAFSTRRAEIIEHLDAVGASSARAAQIATLQTRKTKDASPDVAAIQSEWESRARAIGYEPSSVVDVLGDRRSIELSSFERASAEQLMLGPEGLTEHASTFHQRDVLRAWCEQMAYGAPLSELQLFSAHTIGRDEVVSLYDGRHTTQELLLLERTIIDQAIAGVGTKVAVATSESVTSALASRPSISDEQSVLAQRLLTNGDGVSVVIAAAGTGKGFVLGVAREAWEQSGHHVFGVALAARAAGELHSGAGIRSTTIASTLQRIDNGASLKPNDVFVIDEAGMVGTRQLARLIDHAVTAKAKVVLVGDPRQLPEIDAGGVLSGLAKHVKVLTLHENRRQVEPWEKLALGQLRSGSVETAIKQYESHGRIHWANRVDDVLVDIVDAWSASRGRGEDAIILASRNEDVRALNKLARASDAVTLTGPSYVAAGNEFRINDEVLMLRNDKRIGVRNGDRGSVLDVDVATRSLVVAFKDRTISLPASYLESGHVTHGYAITVHKAQGLTCDRAFVLGTEDLYREMGYVAMSRGRLSNELYAVGERRIEIEPSHSPTVQDSAEELFVSALGTSKAQSMASTHSVAAGPFDSVTDHAIGVEYQELAQRIRSIPTDVSRRVDSLHKEIFALEAKLQGLERQRDQALQTRRSVRETLAGRDSRTTSVDRSIYAEHGWINQLTEKLRPLEAQQQRRNRMLIDTEPAKARLSLLDEEIERRVTARLADAMDSPAEYLTERLGKKPEAGDKRESWLDGVKMIERFRLQNGVTANKHALGNERVPDKFATDEYLNQIVREIDPPSRSRGMRR